MLKSTFIAILLLIGATAMAETETRTVAVNGTGFSEVKPDRAILNMSINARQPSLAAAQSEAAKVTAKVLALTDKLKIDRKYVDTTGASVRPDYRWNREREEQELRGYIAERQMRVEIRDLEQLGEVIEGAVKAGVNQVSPPQLDSGKRRETYRKALAKAATDARENAAQLATSLDMKLGPVMQINAGANMPPPTPMPRMMRADAAMAESAPETYNPGQLSFQANISAVFELIAE